MIALRYMLKEGEESFREFLSKVRENHSIEKPDLNKEPFSKEFLPEIIINDGVTFKTKQELAEYLKKVFETSGVKREDVIGNKGLWTWLAYIWFEQITNNRKNILKRNEHYICTSPSNYRRYYIHLIAPPYIIYSLYGLPLSKLFVYNPPWEINDFTERVAANQFLISHKNIIEAIYRLYFDESRGRPKPGAVSGDVEGSIRRFIKVIQQFEFTYDIYSMSSDQIIDLLPQEFNRWKNLKI
jgi:hypothetical protein